MGFLMKVLMLIVMLVNGDDVAIKTKIVTTDECLYHKQLYTTDSTSVECISLEHLKDQINF